MIDCKIESKERQLHMLMQQRRQLAILQQTARYGLSGICGQGQSLGGLSELSSRACSTGNRDDGALPLENVCPQVLTTAEDTDR